MPRLPGALSLGFRVAGVYLSRTMRNTLRALAVTALAAVGMALTTGAASAAPVGGGGVDVSYPQCPTALPAGQDWGVVGVNGGLPTRGNPCLAKQLSWAAGSTGSVAAQPRTQLYLNTANPGQLIDRISTWPTFGLTPYGLCTGTNTDACSWQYGWERAQGSVTSFFEPAAVSAGLDPVPGDYVWWLDVETYNTWQTGSAAAQTRNRVSLEGMAAYLASRGAEVGIYAVPDQWDEVVGSVTWDSGLYRLPSWLPGATSADEAWRACAKRSLVAGGTVVMTQYVSAGLDQDVSCR